MSRFNVDLRGRTAIVTGAGAGHGRAIAMALAASGARVAVADLNIERAETVADQIATAGGVALALRADVSNRFQAANMIECARDAYGKIDFLVNAARAYRAEPLLQIDEWDWRRQLEVNLSGAFFCLQLMARVMADEGGGRILNLTSVAAVDGAAYMAGKSGVLGLTRQAARELAPLGIRVNAIAAGDVGPSDIAGAALFLCSPAADKISGQVITVDGGDSPYD